MLRGLYCGGLGMMTQAAVLDTVANNLANVSTIGYKYDRSIIKEFEEDFMLRLHEPYKDSRVPIGYLCNGLGLERNFTTFIQGPIISTNNPLDFAIRGDGFFVLRLPDGGEVYTRAGNFFLDKEGFLVNPLGYRVQGEKGDIKLTTPNIRVTEDGEIYKEDRTFVDKLKIVDFENREYLEKLGYTLFLRGRATETIPKETTILQAHLENSNVNPLFEMINLIKLQRLYELNQRVVIAFDDLLARAINDAGRTA